VEALKGTTAKDEMRSSVARTARASLVLDASFWPLFSVCWDEVFIFPGIGMEVT